MSTKTTIPEHYRQWAKQEAEREYPRKMWPEGTLDEVRRQREGYEAALLRMWPVVEALQRMCEWHEKQATWDKGDNGYYAAKQALSSLNLPQP